jgi:hypothetical protein
MILLPMTNQPNQNFSLTIPKGRDNIRLAFFLGWNEIANYWQMTISNIETQTELINLMPLVFSVPLRQYQYFGINQAIIIKTGNTQRDYPGVNDWGENFNMYWT